MDILEQNTKQEIYEGTESYRNIEYILEENTYKKILVVCGSAFKCSQLPAFFDEIRLNYCIYDSFQPNPTYENILEGLSIFRNNQCDFIISVGGGSAIDVAKCIKAYANMSDDTLYVDQEVTDNSVYHLAMPTTAGTGSESTHFAVMYYKENKISVNHPSLLPNAVILEPSLLATLPDYQKKATLLDALCQATESFWSVKSNDISRAYAKEAINLILKYGKPYIHANNNLIEIFHAANLAGRAINITQTTLAHAMSYKLTSLYGISHGHAVAICMPYVWEYLNENTDKMQEGRSSEEMEQLLDMLNVIYHCKSTKETVALFRGMMSEFGLKIPDYVPEHLDTLADSVNAERMKNYPAIIEKAQLKDMYQHILTDKNKLTVSNQLHYHVACDMRELEDLSEIKQMKALKMEVREGEKILRVEAAGELLEAILIYGSQDESEEINEIVSELIISINGYPIENEVDTINYRNAQESLKKYREPVTEEDLKKASDLAAAHGITPEHGLVLQRFIKIIDLFKDNTSKIAGVFGVQNSTVNTNILRGMLYQFNLLVKGNKDYKKINQPAKYSKAHEYVLYWISIQTHFYNDKYNCYLTELRKVQLEMMDEIARVCDENHLTYVLNYGSLLGAIRHGGSIPWDDDLDICMPREDYEKFLEIGRKELKKGCYLYNNQDFHDCWFSMMKVMKKDTEFVRHPYRFGEEDGQRIFIDVWPLDNVMGPEENAVKRMKRRKSVLTRLLRLKIKARCGGELNFKQKVRSLILKPISEKALIRAREKNVTRWRDQDTDYWISGGVYNYIKETMPKAWYVPTTTLPYEGHEYKFPGNWKEVLQHFYGNYMQVPPLDKRFTHAPFKVCMGKGKKALYFNETRHRGRRSLSSKIKRKIRKYFRIMGEKMSPLTEVAHFIGVSITGFARNIGIAISGNSKRFLSYKNRYQGQTCYVTVNSSFLSEDEMNAVKTGISFMGDQCYRILDDKRWKPDFYCISEKSKEDKMPAAIVHSDKTEIFYTKKSAKGRKARLRRGIRVPSRSLGSRPKESGMISGSYYDDEADNLAFMLELAVFMGFAKIIITGNDTTYDMYNMKHSLKTEIFDEADLEYEKYLITKERCHDILSKLNGDKTQILRYDKLNKN